MPHDADQPRLPAVVIVSGAGSGLGRAVAQQLAARGTAVAVVDRDEVAAAETVRLIGEACGVAQVYVTDVADWASVERSVRAAADELGRPGGLVNAAAIYRSTKTLELDPADWQRIIGINLTGTFHLCRAALPLLLDTPAASIVNVASTAGMTGFPYLAAYSASKAGVIQLTRSLAVEFSLEQLRVNAVVPGGMQTPMLVTAPIDGASPELMSTVRRSRLPLAEPDDVANVVRFLLSSEARYLTGSIVVADGGSLA